MVDMCAVRCCCTKRGSSICCSCLTTTVWRLAYNRWLPQCNKNQTLQSVNQRFRFPWMSSTMSIDKSSRVVPGLCTAPMFQVWDHIAKRVKWADPGMEMEVGTG